MTDWLETAEQVRAGIAADIEVAQQRAKAATRVRQEIEQIRGVAVSNGDQVKVTVDSTGRLISLELSEGVITLGARGIEQAVLDTARKAQQAAIKAVVEIAGREFGEDSELTSRIQAEAESKLAPQPTQEPRSNTNWSGMLRPGGAL